MSSSDADPSQFTLSIDVDLRAPRAAVWRCWTEPELFCQWFCPKPWTIAEADFDLRPGGRMNNVMQGPNGERFENTGIWLEIEPLHRLVFTDTFREGYIPLPDSFMTGFVKLSDIGRESTRMVWGARHATEEKMRTHLEMGFESGWRTAAGQLSDIARWLAGPAGRAMQL